ncbi:MAG TPA: FHA domain-containing protein, partial [Bryobacteraceae bacterium]
MAAQTPGLTATWVIGAAPDCDIVVDGQGVVSGRHCRLSLFGSQFVVEDLGSRNGTYVNGYKLQPNAPVYVNAGDVVTLAASVPFPWPTAAPVQAAPAPPPPPPPPPPQMNGNPQTIAMPTASHQAAAAGVISIGRNPRSDIQLDYPMISWDHARIFPRENGWVIEDLRSTNGTALNRIDNRIQTALLSPGDDIYLGSYKIAASLILERRQLNQGESAFERVNFRGDQMVFGRDPSCDYPLDFPMISWRHAILKRTPQGLVVEDLNSRNGTYVNGMRVGSALVQPGMEIGLGSFRFQLLEDGGFAKRHYAGNVTIEVNSVSVNAPNGTPLLDPISLTIFPSELVALMGPAGAGKTTFLKSLNGYTRPARGLVLFNGADLYRFYDRFRQQMSYVPQDDIVHAQLKVREALYYSAKLRTDLTDGEIEQRIDRVLNSLGIFDKKHAIIGSPENKVLSGGQRKRVNIAMELINDTPVIFLDEPTSGLSSYDAEGVIKLLKTLSSQGKTIITTIHQPSLDIFKQFDSLIMIARDRGSRGALAYFGPAHPDSIEFFDPEGVQAVRAQPGTPLSPEMVLSGLAKRPTAEWIGTYEQSKYKRLFVTERSGKVPSTPNAAGTGAVRQFGLGQWWQLVRRNLILKGRDRFQAAILLAQAPLFGLLVALVFHDLSSSDPADFQGWAEYSGKLAGVHFLMVVAAIWFGCNNSARDIVGEWTVYQRERMVSLKLPSYVFSKFAVAAALSLFQCATLLVIVRAISGLQGDFVSTLGILWLSSLVGAGMGLCASALASTTEAAIAMLPLILLPMIALGGGITPVAKMKSPMKEIAMAVPSRWSMEANLLTEARAYHSPQRQHILEDDNDIAERHFPTHDSPDGKIRKVSRTSLAGSVAVLGGMLVFWL